MCLLRLMAVFGQKTNFCGFGVGWCGCVVVDAGTEVTICYRKSSLVNMIVFIMGMERWGLCLM